MIDLTRIRRNCRNARRTLSTREQYLHSLKVANSIGKTSWFWRAKKIAVYLARDGELDLTPVVNRLLHKNKLPFLPVLRLYPPRKLWFARYLSETKLHLNRFAIPEPCINKFDTRFPIFLDAVLVPMVAFNENCQRLGMGGGFYDRTFAYQRHKLQWKRPRLIGIAHECQRVTPLPKRYWDVPMNMVITENNVYTNG